MNALEFAVPTISTGVPGLTHPTVPRLAQSPPAKSGPDSVLIRCVCTNALGATDAGWFFTRRRGRILTARLPVRVVCEECGAVSEIAERG